jgi:hypothetical protein
VIILGWRNREFISLLPRLSVAASGHLWCQNSFPPRDIPSARGRTRCKIIRLVLYSSALRISRARRGETFPLLSSIRRSVRLTRTPTGVFVLGTECSYCSWNPAGMMSRLPDESGNLSTSLVSLRRVKNSRDAPTLIDTIACFGSISTSSSACQATLLYLVTECLNFRRPSDGIQCSARELIRVRTHPNFFPRHRPAHEQATGPRKVYKSRRKRLSFCFRQEKLIERDF